MRTFFQRHLLSFFIFVGALFVAQTGYPDTTYIIQKGDNPSKIARKFHVRAQDILVINNLNPRKLIPGTEIRIPQTENESLDTDDCSLDPDITRESDNKDKEPLPDDGILHTVKKGDTLSGLSKKYSVTISELQTINNLTSTKLIIGQTLLVRQMKHHAYIVKKGDSLWRIAQRFDLDIDELFEINNLDTDVLKPGQTILLRYQEEPQNLNSSQAPDMNHIEDGIVEAPETDEYTLKEKLVMFAKKFIDIPYRFGGKSFLGIDCSAFVQKVYEFIGIKLPRSAREQFSHGKSIDKDKLSIGDLVFFRTYASFPSHVGIYLGNNEFIHSSSKLKKVTIDNLDTPYYLKRFIGAKRLIHKEDNEGKNEQLDES
jgi:LysM repeat protein